MKESNTVSFKELYELIDHKIEKVNLSILRLESKFDLLEAGRLSSLEKEFENLKGRMSIIAAVISIAISAFFYFGSLFIGK